MVIPDQLTRISEIVQRITGRPLSEKDIKRYLRTGTFLGNGRLSEIPKEQKNKPKPHRYGSV